MLTLLFIWNKINIIHIIIYIIVIIISTFIYVELSIYVFSFPLLIYLSNNHITSINHKHLPSHYHLTIISLSHHYHKHLSPHYHITINQVHGPTDYLHFSKKSSEAEDQEEAAEGFFSFDSDISGNILLYIMSMVSTIMMMMVWWWWCWWW